MEQLARLAIRPLRIAFDDIKLKHIYCDAVRCAHRHGIKEFQIIFFLIIKTNQKTFTKDCVLISNLIGS